MKARSVNSLFRKMDLEEVPETAITLFATSWARIS